MPKNIKLPFPVVQKSKGNEKPNIPTDPSSGKPVWYREVAVIAVPADKLMHRTDTSGIIDITGYYNPEQEFLQWSAPAGEWDVYRFCMFKLG